MTTRNNEGSIGKLAREKTWKDDWRTWEKFMHANLNNAKRGTINQCDIPIRSCLIVNSDLAQVESLDRVGWSGLALLVVVRNEKVPVKHIVKHTITTTTIPINGIVCNGRHVVWGFPNSSPLYVPEEQATKKGAVEEPTTGTAISRVSRSLGFNHKHTESVYVSNLFSLSHQKPGRPKK